MNYNDIKFIDQLLRRVERLEQKVGDLQDRNQKLQRIMKDSFISFRFNENKDRVTIANREEFRGYFDQLDI